VSSPDRIERAAGMLERLLTDDSFRLEFSRDPGGSCRASGLPDLATELERGAGGMYTLEMRESKSPLAGVMLAAAFEAASVLEFAHVIGPELNGEAAAAAHVALSRQLPAIRAPAVPGDVRAAESALRSAPARLTAAGLSAVAGGRGRAAALAAAAAAAKGDAPPPPAPSAVAPGAPPAGAPAVPGAAPPAAAAAPGAAAPAAGAAAAAPGAAAPAAGAAAAAPGAAAPAAGAAAAAPGAAAPAAGAAAAAPGAAAPAAGAAAAAAPQGSPQPGSSPAPTSAAPPPGAAAATPAAAPGAAATPAADAAAAAPGGVAAPAPSLTDAVAAGRAVLGPGVAEVLADAKVDPAIAAGLGRVAAAHTIQISSVSAAGGNLALAITHVDGQPVGPANVAARDLAAALTTLDGNERPAWLGTPWPLSASGAYVDQGRGDRIVLEYGEGPRRGGDAAFMAASATPAATPQTAAFEAVGARQHRAPEFEPRQGPADANAAAADAGTGAPAADAGPNPYPGDDASKPQIAHWMATEARKRGLPGELPVMAALVESRLENLDHGHADSVGYFQMRLQYWNQGKYAGYPDDPNKQLAWFLDEAEKLKGTHGGADPSEYGEWVADVEKPAAAYRGRYAAQLGAAQKLLAAPVPQPAGGGAAAVPGLAGGPPAAGGLEGGGGGGWLAAARGQLGVREAGYNAGAKVEAFQRAADVGRGSAWCAAFVTWSIEKSTGKQMPGSGWAAVATWVSAARRGEHGLSFVDAKDARPGDIVAYDWGGGNDFGGDGHIGFLESEVRDGKFTAVEGNAEDAVSRQSRNVNVGNVVFIRFKG